MLGTFLNNSKCFAKKVAFKQRPEQCIGAMQTQKRTLRWREQLCKGPETGGWGRGAEQRERECLRVQANDRGLESFLWGDSLPGFRG